MNKAPLGQKWPSAEALSATALRQRTVDGRGIADIRLLQLEDGPGRGQRLLVCRNATGIGFEIAVDRGFDVSSASWRGMNIGWNSANRMPWPPNSVDAEDGFGFYRNIDGFIVTCGLDHIGAARRDDGDRFIHKHRKQIFHPLHGRISSQRASLTGYGINWDVDVPVIWAEAVVVQCSVFGENLGLKRRIQLDVFGNVVSIDDTVDNRGFRPTPHAILYHVNFGYPFLDEMTQISGTVSADTITSFNAEDKRPKDDFIDYYEDVSVVSDLPTAAIELRNEFMSGGVRVRLSFLRKALPNLGIWRAFQSGVYALALEPARKINEDTEDQGSLRPGETAKYRIDLEIGSLGVDVANTENANARP